MSKDFDEEKIVERFWAKVIKGTEPDDCWLWKGCIVSGYGQFRSGEKRVYAHRFAYELLVNQIPVGLQLDHLCETRNCVNPDHLEPVTNAENQRRSRKDHCRRGHPINEENSYYDNNGNRQCRPCCNISKKERRAQQRLDNADTPKLNIIDKICKRGHPMEGANLYIGPNGYERCRQCHNLSMKINRVKYNQKSKGAE